MFLLHPFQASYDREKSNHNDFSAPIPNILYLVWPLLLEFGLDWNYAWLHLPDRNLLEYTIKEFYAQIESAADNLERASTTACMSE